MENIIFTELVKNSHALLKKEMEKNKIGFNDLVKYLGTSPTQVSNILNGNANIPFDSLAKICTVFDIEPHIIFKKIIIKTPNLLFHNS